MVGISRMALLNTSEGGKVSKLAQFTLFFALPLTLESKLFKILLSCKQLSNGMLGCCLPHQLSILIFHGLSFNQIFKYRLAIICKLVVALCYSLLETNLSEFN